MRIDFLLDPLKVKLIKYLNIGEEVHDFLRLLLDRITIPRRTIEPVFEDGRYFCFFLSLISLGLRFGVDTGVHCVEAFQLEVRDVDLNLLLGELEQLRQFIEVSVYVF